MRLLALCLALSSAVCAGVISGVVLEHQSGKPLARTLIRVQAIPGQRSMPLMEVRAGRTGQFTFPSVPDGLYLITTQREGFYPGAYGQRRPSGFGTPVLVTVDSNLFTELRMRRMGSITGIVTDQNSVGIAGTEMLAYPAQLPLRPVARAVADDRGIYRIFGLLPGKYWVRSGVQTLEDGSGLIPTFGPQSGVVRDAQIHRANMDTETTDANLRPYAGTLYRLSGRILCDRAESQVLVTLSSELGQQSSTTGCKDGSFSFGSLAPAAYEVFAIYADGGGSGFTEVLLNHDTQLPSVQLLEQPPVEIEVVSSGGEKSPIRLTGRRDDLSGAGKLVDIRLPKSNIPPGHWELTAFVGPGNYVESIINTGNASRRSWRTERPSEWFDVFIANQFRTRLRITVSNRAAQIAGTVKSENLPIAGAPVFLWPLTEAARRSLGGTRQVFSDTSGKFRFEGLPPGDYRLLTTFDYQAVDLDLLEEARALTLRLDPSQTASVDLPLWVAP